MKYKIDPITQKAIKKFPHRSTDIAQSFDEKQIKSKEWLVQELFKVFYTYRSETISKIKKINILGSWYGQVLSELLTTNLILEEKFLELDQFKNIDKKDLYIKTSNLSFYEIDAEAIEIGKLYNPDSKFCNQDVTEIEFSGSDKLIINTSCEHMKPINVKKSIIALQSNNYFEVEDHINCVNNVEELIDQYDFKEIYYKGELDFEKYKRFMVIGKLN